MRVQLVKIQFSRVQLCLVGAVRVSLCPKDQKRISSDIFLESQILVIFSRFFMLPP